MVTKEYGSGPHYPEDVEVGLIKIDSHTKVNCIVYIECYLKCVAI
jgi:hypothetical protein